MCSEALNAQQIKELDVNQLNKIITEIELYYAKVDPTSAVIPQRMAEMKHLLTKGRAAFTSSILFFQSITSLKYPADNSQTNGSKY